jgi:metacaspase-1
MVDADQIKKAIPAKFYMISGSEDKQTSADVSNVGAFTLPNPAGKAGGACTSTLLSVLTQLRGQPITWMELLHQMRGVLRQKGFDQVPQLSTSRLIDVNERFQIVPDRSKQVNASRRAILIGINYIGTYSFTKKKHERKRECVSLTLVLFYFFSSCVSFLLFGKLFLFFVILLLFSISPGQQGQLSGCHNDVKNIKQYLIEQEGFPEKDMLVLMDDGHHHSPTRRNLEDAFKRITQYAKADDVVFIHYSGHGGRIRDTSGDEADGYDETLIPVDFKSAGQIVDDQVYAMLVKAMPADVNVTVLVRTYVFVELNRIWIGSN